MEDPTPIASLATQSPRAGVGFMYRAGAQIIDLILHNLLTVSVGLGIGITMGFMAVLLKTSSAQLTAKLQETNVVDYVFPLIGYAVYHIVCEGFHGATLGKRVLGIHVVQEDGSPCSLGAAVIRSLVFYLDAAFFGLVAAASMRASELRQRYGDKWAHTVVVERAQLSQFDWSSRGGFIVVLLSALFADGLFYACSLFIKLLI
jgi:uncharacterized RDD family membrane protein YckC